MVGLFLELYKVVTCVSTCPCTIRFRPGRGGWVVAGWWLGGGWVVAGWWLGGGWVFRRTNALQPQGKVRR